MKEAAENVSADQQNITNQEMAMLLFRFSLFGWIECHFSFQPEQIRIDVVAKFEDNAF